MSESMTRREFVTVAAVAGVGIAVAGATGCTPGAGANKDRGADTVDELRRGRSDEQAGSRGLRDRNGFDDGRRRGDRQDPRRARVRGGREADEGAPCQSKATTRSFSAVRSTAGQWLPEAVEYLEANQKALGKVSVSLFCVHAMNCGPDPKKTKKRLAYLDKERALVKPADEGFFAGQGPTGANSNAITRWAFRAFGGDVEGDGRDWDCHRGVGRARAGVGAPRSTSGIRATDRE